MTEKEAQRELRRKLVFGDDRQIRAIKFLDSLSSCIEEIKTNPDCDECQGLGQFYQDCSQCSGSGCVECADGETLDACPTCDGSGVLVTDVLNYPDDIIILAFEKIKSEKVLEGAA
jgi:hypothetical protein